MKSKKGILTIILIVSTIVLILLSWLSYTSYKEEERNYLEEINNIQEKLSINYSSLNYEQREAIQSLDLSSRIYDETHKNFTLIYMTHAELMYKITRNTALIFIILTIISWKIDNLTKK